MVKDDVEKKLEIPEAVTAEDIAVAQEALKLTAASLARTLAALKVYTNVLYYCAQSAKLLK